MQKILFHTFTFLLSKLSLSSIHSIGKIFGRLYFSLSKKNLNLLKENLINSGIFPESDIDFSVQQTIEELGKGILETFFIWGLNQKAALKLIHKVYGKNAIEKAEKSRKGIIFLAPHLGCFEINSIFYGENKPITVMYRKARKLWMSDLMIKGRKKGYVELAPADTSGLKKVLIALKKGQAVGILPDQVADKGNGEYVNFFGKPAYTMLLANKLIEKTEAQIFMAYGERLKDGKGFNIHIEEINRRNIKTPLDLNKQVERFIKKNPTQYYWSYDRYKTVISK